jgi:ferric-dicitrate binding protein FerR (iron transport regulator)
MTIPKPVGTDDADVPYDLGLAVDRIDAVAMMYGSGTYAAIGSATPGGRVYFANDLGPNGERMYTDGTAWRPNTPTIVPIVTITADRALLLADAGAFIRGDKTTTLTLTVPANSTTAFPIGTQMMVKQQNTGQVVIAAAGGVTIELKATHTAATSGRYAGVTLTKEQTNVWSLIGDLA